MKPDTLNSSKGKLLFEGGGTHTGPSPGEFMKQKLSNSTHNFNPSLGNTPN